MVYSLCPKCQRKFRGDQCPCGAEPPPPPAHPGPNPVQPKRKLYQPEPKPDATRSSPPLSDQKLHTTRPVAERPARIKGSKVTDEKLGPGSPTSSLKVPKPSDTTPRTETETADKKRTRRKTSPEEV